MTVSILNGWNTFGAESIAQRAIEATTVSGQSLRSSTTIEVCKSTKEVRESLKIDSSVAVTYGDFSADLKAGYMRSLQLTSNSVVVMARVFSEQTEVIEGQPRILVPLTTPEERVAFFRKYGDSYISSVTRGFEVLISYVLHATSREEQLKVASSIEGSGVAGGAKISASFAMEMENFSRETGLRWSLKTEKFGIAGPSVTRDNYEAVIDQLQQSDPGKSTHIVSFKATPYTRYIDDSAESRQVAANLDALHGTRGRAGWAATHEQLRAVRNSIEAVVQVYGVYGYAGDTQVQGRLATVDERLDEVEKHFRAVGQDPWKPAELPTIEPRVLEEPVLNFDVQVAKERFGSATTTAINYGMFGTVVNGTAAYDRASVRRGEWIKRIRAFTGDWMNGLEVTYSEALGDSTDRTVANGNTSGKLATDLELAKGRGIVAIRGRAGNYLDALEFEYKAANAGRTLTRSAGNMAAGNREVTWKVGEDEFLLGFQGWGGDWLDTVSPIVVTFYPASWH